MIVLEMIFPTLVTSCSSSDDRTSASVSSRIRSWKRCSSDLMKGSPSESSSTCGSMARIFMNDGALTVKCFSNGRDHLPQGRRVCLGGSLRRLRYGRAYSLKYVITDAWDHASALTPQTVDRRWQCRRLSSPSTVTSARGVQFPKHDARLSCLLVSRSRHRYFWS